MGFVRLNRGFAVWSMLGLLAAGTAMAQDRGGGAYGGGYLPGLGIGNRAGAYYGSGFSISMGRSYGDGYGGVYYGGIDRRPRYNYPTPNSMRNAPTYIQQASASAVAPVQVNSPVEVSAGDVVILFPTDGSEAVVDYALNGSSYSMRTGQTQRFPNDRRWTIEFNRGGDFGTARYSLSPGTFKFKITDRGRELVRAASDLPTPAQ